MELSETVTKATQTSALLVDDSTQALRLLRGTARADGMMRLLGMEEKGLQQSLADTLNLARSVHSRLLQVCDE